MKFQSIFTVVLFTLFQFAFSINSNGQGKCDKPFELELVRTAINSSCTDTIYAFTYNNEQYIYITRKDGCIATDWSNELYNCNTGTSCYIFGFTLPEDQCSGALLEDIFKFATSEYAIYPINLNCRPQPNLRAEKADIYVDSACHGLILTAPNGICFRLTVKNDGDINANPIQCPN